MTPPPVVAIVGRPNVGKSALFNRLSGKRIAIVEDVPGLTRDRLYAEVDWNRRRFTLVDTGGLVTDPEAPIQAQVRRQVEVAIAEAAVILFVVDARAGLTPKDRGIADLLRRASRPVVLVANKVDSPAQEPHAAEFYELGLGEPMPVSGLNGIGTGDLLDAVAALLPEETAEAGEEPEPRRVAIAGRPNVGKSSLLNALAGAERAIVLPTPGTTRDAVDTSLSWEGRPYVLVDTAGLRRPSQVGEGIERYAVSRSLRAVDRADVVVLVIDATQGIADQDQRIARYALEQGRAVVIAVNKWDTVGRPPRRSDTDGVRQALRFVDFAPVVFISATKREGLDRLMRAVETALAGFDRRIGTGEVNRVVEQAEAAVQPPADRAGRRLKIRYATQAQAKPPTFVLFVNDPELLAESYRRYLERRLREAFDFEGTPVRLVARGRRGPGREERP